MNKFIGVLFLSAICSVSFAKGPSIGGGHIPTDPGGGKGGGKGGIGTGGGGVGTSPPSPPVVIPPIVPPAAPLTPQEILRGTDLPGSTKARTTAPVVPYKIPQGNDLYEIKVIPGCAANIITVSGGVITIRCK